ncbi:MAG: hypothetical protein QHC90_08060 [Shinella sp.]|jgi:ABC-type uncharacterized transport system auxiliary subunit|nr:hypothetical protein [Shinella sp.]
MGRKGNLEKKMPFKALLTAAAIALLALSGCASTAANNTTYARPPDSGGLRIPIN